MDKKASSDIKNKSNDPPAPEVLKAQVDNLDSDDKGPTTGKPKAVIAPWHAIYRPSHKATFIGLAVVVAILAVNAGIIAYLMMNRGSSDNSVQGEVSISSTVLEGLGVSRNSVGSTGTELIVNPNSSFKGTLTVAGDVSLAGQLKLNRKFSAGDAAIAKLEAGDTVLGQLSVNGDGTLSNLNLRKDLNVVGLTQLQGLVTISQLLTVNNSVNVSGSLSVGGTLSTRGFQASSLVSDTTLTIGGHIITRGYAPGLSRGPALGPIDNVTNSGNDASGTIALNVGASGMGAGIIANLTFSNPYSNIPHVMVTAVGRGLGSVYVNRSTTGFSVGVNDAVPLGSYAIDYIVMQ
jgi:hypothetical protein